MFKNYNITSPNKSNNRRRSAPRTTGSKKSSNINSEKLDKAINKVKEFLPESAERKSERNDQNPNNAIFIDVPNKKVYKFGLWLDEERCIRNEFIAYTLLLKEDYDGMNIHYPEMHDCQKIEGTKYAILTLEYIPDIQMVCFPSKKNNQNMNVIKNNKINKNNNLSKCNNHLNNTSRTNLINDACQYLNNVGIKHNDEKQNLFYHTGNGKFLWMDFEAATFDKNKLNMCSKLLLQKNVKISYANSTNISPIFMENFNLNSPSSNKKRKKTTFSNNHNSSNLTNRLGL